MYFKASASLFAHQNKQRATDYTRTVWALRSSTHFRLISFRRKRILSVLEIVKNLLPACPRKMNRCVLRLSEHHSWWLHPRQLIVFFFSVYSVDGSVLCNTSFRLTYLRCPVNICMNVQQPCLLNVLMFYYLFILDECDGKPMSVNVKRKGII